MAIHGGGFRAAPVFRGGGYRAAESITAAAIATDTVTPTTGPHFYHRHHFHRRFYAPAYYGTRLTMATGTATAG